MKKLKMTVGRLIENFQENVQREPLMPAGAPLGYMPRRNRNPARDLGAK